MKAYLFFFFFKWEEEQRAHQPNYAADNKQLLFKEDDKRGDERVLLSFSLFFSLSLSLSGACNTHPKAFFLSFYKHTGHTYLNYINLKDDLKENCLLSYRLQGSAKVCTPLRPNEDKKKRNLLE